jgi:hypothetical protein
MPARIAHFAGGNLGMGTLNAALDWGGSKQFCADTVALPLPSRRW